MNRIYVFLLVLLSFCWGPSFYFIKIALKSFSPLMIVQIRLTIATVVLYFILKSQKTPLLKWFRCWKQFLTMSILAVVLPWSLLSFAEEKTSSALAGVMNSCVPIFTCILAHYFLENEKFSKQKLTGLCFGFVGIGLIFIPSVIASGIENALGLGYLIFGCISSASSIVYAKKHLTSLPSLIPPFMQMLFGTVVITSINLSLKQEVFQRGLYFESIIAILILGIIATALAFILFYYLISHAGATFTSTSSLIIPLLSIFFGVIFLSEKITPLAYVGTLFVLISLVITNSLIKIKTLKALFVSREEEEFKE